MHRYVSLIYLVGVFIFLVLVERIILNKFRKEYHSNRNIIFFLIETTSLTGVMLILAAGISEVGRIFLILFLFLMLAFEVFP